MTHTEVLNRVYAKASSLVETQGDADAVLSRETRSNIRFLSPNFLGNKGLLAVLVTLLTHKIVNPAQDIRYHMNRLPNGFSGRTIDTREITPFLKSVKFPAMQSGSGWLTRSLEQHHAYTLDYPGGIKPEGMKTAFLQTIHRVQVQGEDPEDILVFLFTLLIRQKVKEEHIKLSRPKDSLPISKIIELLEKHFSHKYEIFGAARLPVLALYAAYQCMMEQVSRYKGKVLCPLESHNSADTKSGRIGDIDVNDETGDAFEGVEIKHGIQITPLLVADAYEKFKMHKTDRYYLLTTADMSWADWKSINEEIKRISDEHGCQVIVNGVYPTLKYYLRLMENPAVFLTRYRELLSSDGAVKLQHKEFWNDLVENEMH